MYGSQSELLAQGIELKQLLGLISHMDPQGDKDQFSVDIQAAGMSCAFSLTVESKNVSYIDEEASASKSPSSPTSPPAHVMVPLSPLVKHQLKADGSNFPLRPSASYQVATPSPRIRRRNVEDDILQNNFELDVFTHDTASVFSMPSMLSLHSHLEGVASRNEDQEVVV